MLTLANNWTTALLRRLLTRRRRRPRRLASTASPHALVASAQQLESRVLLVATGWALPPFSGDWFDDNRWTLGTPDANTDAEFKQAATYTVTVDSAPPLLPQAAAILADRLHFLTFP